MSYNKSNFSEITLSKELSSIFHFTGNKGNGLDIIKSILTTKGFRYKYCLEDFKFGEKTVTQNGKDLGKSAFPMVSFCDIPLSQIHYHINSYGSYGIGLTKDWAVEKELNPVLYINKNSRVTKSLKDLLFKPAEILLKHIENKGGMETFTQGDDVKEVLKNHSEYAMILFDIISYSKNYKGYNEFYDRHNYPFYLEREWRHIHKDNNKGLIPLLEADYNAIKDNNKDGLFVENVKLEFNIKDISYIIVENDSEIPEIVQLIEKEYSSCSLTDVKVLCSRILTKKQIFDDL